MNLNDFPIPRNKSKRAIHWTASCYPEEGHWQSMLDHCEEMKIGWIKFVDDGGASGMNVYREVLRRGMIPIVRFYVGNDTWSPRVQDATKRILDMAGHTMYFEYRNEPDLPDEWPDKKQPKDWLNQEVNRFAQYAEGCIGLGGLPGTFALAGGAFGELRIDQYGNRIEPVKVNYLRLIESKCPGIFNRGAWVAIHNYTLNHDLYYPDDAVNQLGKPVTQAEYDRYPDWAWDKRGVASINDERARNKNPGDTIEDDSNCLGMYRLALKWLAELGYTQTPIITTEGGPCMTDGQDGRYPKICQVNHPEFVEGIYRIIGPIPQYFAYCHWMLWNTTGKWLPNCWYFGMQDHSATIEKMKQTPLGAWGEVFGETGPVEPPKPPEPPTPPEPPKPPEDTTVNDAVAYGVTVNSIKDLKEGAWYWKCTKVHHLTPTENNGMHNLFVEVLDENGKRVKPAGVTVKNVNGAITTIVLDKPDNEPAGNCQINPQDKLMAWVSGTERSEEVSGMHTQHPDELPVTAWGHPGNSVSHHSFFVQWTWTKNGTVTPPVDPPVEPPPSTGTWTITEQSAKRIVLELK